MRDRFETFAVSTRGRIYVRPNAVLRPTTTAKRTACFPYALFAGRLSEEKGVRVLMDSLERGPGFRLHVIGTGPLCQLVQKAALMWPDRIYYLGQVPHTDALAIVRDARVLVYPSLWHETFGLSLMEAMAAGVPVVASNLGAMAEIVTDGQDGFLVPPGDSVELARRVHQLMMDDDLHARMSAAARRTYETRYSPEISYSRLMEIYQLAIESARRRKSAA
ncbi:MAG TPA: glycosyltransferase family 4 protein [Candidatus Polarisedimenticolia bacterium]|nr:glycosyltransferase family 4 protein [Candidatus Polarisedimenticolia bacterium]